MARKTLFERNFAEIAKYYCNTNAITIHIGKTRAGPGNPQEILSRIEK